MSLKKNWQPVIDRLHKKLFPWKDKMLSIGGRLTLVKSVLGSLLVFYFSLYKALVAIINTIEKLRRCFYGE